MDIKLIRNFENGKYMLLEDNLVLQEVDDEEYSLGGFAGKKLYIVDIVENTRLEIMEGVKKFRLFSIDNAMYNKTSVYFSTASRLNEESISISLIKYTVEEHAAVTLFTLEEKIEDLKAGKELKVIVLDDNYLYVQKKMNKQYEVYLFNNEDSSIINICDETIIKSGIDKIIPLERNLCVIKTGYSVLEEALYDSLPEADCPVERIGFINIKQFISDLVLSKENIYIDELDRGSQNRTFPYLKMMEGSIIYSRVDIKEHKEELVIYDYISKVTKIRINTHLVRVSDLWNTYIINDTPYFLSEKEHETEFVNLNTKKTEWTISGEYRIRFIKNNIIIVSTAHKGIFGKENDFIVAYRYPDVETTIFKEKAKYTDCLITKNDELLIFSS